METMNGPILVTGATGLVGANICQIAAEQGLRLRALVRDGTEVEGLAELDLEIVDGDITVADDVARAASGVRGIIHTAALVAGIWPKSMAADNERVNVGGTVNVLVAAAP